MSNYRKLVASAVGLTALFLNRQYGLDLFGAETMVVDLVISAGTAAAVWWFPNSAAE